MFYNHISIAAQNENDVTKKLYKVSFQFYQLTNKTSVSFD